MIWSILAGGVLVAWAMLRIMGTERQNRIDAFQAEIRLVAARAKKQDEAVIVLK